MLLFGGRGIEGLYFKRCKNDIFMFQKSSKINMWKLIHIHSGSVKFRSKKLFFGRCTKITKFRPNNNKKGAVFIYVFVCYVYSRYESILLSNFSSTCYMCMYSFLDFFRMWKYVFLSPSSCPSIICTFREIYVLCELKVTKTSHNEE